VPQLKKLELAEAQRLEQDGLGAFNARQVESEKNSEKSLLRKLIFAQ